MLRGPGSSRKEDQYLDREERKARENPLEDIGNVSLRQFKIKLEHSRPQKTTQDNLRTSKKVSDSNEKYCTKPYGKLQPNLANSLKYV
jgi:hypothetical protein